MPILSRPSGGSEQLDGIEYTYPTSSNISKNQLCYVNGTAPAKFGNRSILSVNGEYPSWIKIDENRVLILWLQPSSAVDLMGIVATFNDGSDKTTNPFIYDISKATTIVSNFPFNANYQCTLVRMNDANKEVFLFKYGSYVYLIEIKNETEITLIANYNYKSSLNLKYVNENYYADLFWNNTFANAYQYYDISLNPSTGILTFYTFNFYLSSQMGIGQNITLTGLTNYRFLRAFKTDNDNYFVVLASPSGSTTTYVFYNITFMEMEDPEGNMEKTPFTFEEILSYTTTAEYDNLFCTYNDGVICITGHALNSQFTNLFTFQVNDYDKNNIVISFCKEITQKIATAGGWSTTVVSLQNVILPNNIICSFDTAPSENDYFLYSIIANSVLEIKKINTYNPVIITQNNIPIVKNNTIYNIYKYTQLSKTFIYVSVVDISNLIYPLVSLDSAMNSSIGIAKDDYTANQLATIIHPPYEPL